MFAAPYVSVRAAGDAGDKTPLDLKNGDWQLTFSDEFNGDGLDRTVWKPSDYWSNQTLAGNGELQCYLPDAASVQAGRLILTARRQPTPAAQCKGAANDLSFVSGMVTTAGCYPGEPSPHCGSLKSFNQAYGAFEMRAKLPRGRGLWPAFWLVPSDASWPPEIDILENIGDPSVLYQSYHFTAASGEKGKDGNEAKFPDTDFSEDFHTFAAVWNPGEIIWYVDGREVYRVKGEHVTSKPMYILLNLAVGGHWPGAPADSVQFPAKMEVDYVRVYQRATKP
jgi:beta-glucanase (GH16 family)